MPYRKVTFPPGINREGTQYSAEGNWYDCDLIRFRQGRPEKISTNEFLGISRSLLNWSSIAGANLMAIGSDKKLYVDLGGVYHDITPMDYKSQGTLTNADINDAATTAQFDFDVTSGDVIRMGSDANAVGDELISVGSTTSANNPVTISRGYANTTPSAHSVGDAAFLLENLSDPIYLVQNSTTVLISYTAHGLTSGDFVNFLKIDGTLTGITNLVKDDLFYPSRATVEGYDTTKSTQSFPVTRVLTADYFEIRVATAPTGLSSSTLNMPLGLSSSGTTIVLDFSTPIFQANDFVKIGDEYIQLGTTSDNLTFTSCLRSQFGSMSKWYWWIRPGWQHCHHAGHPGFRVYIYRV
jgi:hypothetical protein